MMMHPFPNKASVFLDALDAAASASKAAARHRQDGGPQAGMPHAGIGAGRWAAMAVIPVALVAVAWIL